MVMIEIQTLVVAIHDNNLVAAIHDYTFVRKTVNSKYRDNDSVDARGGNEN